MIYLLLLIGVYFSYLTYNHQRSLLTMYSWLNEQDDELASEPDFKQELEEYRKTKDNIKSFITDTTNYIFPFIVLMFLNAWVMFIPKAAADPVVLVALAAGYGVWYWQIRSILRHRFITEGFCIAIIELKTAMKIYKYHLDENDEQ